MSGFRWTIPAASNAKVDRLCFTNELGYIPHDSNAPSTPSTPTGLTAGDGTYSDRVALDWADTAFTTSYKVFRNTTNSPNQAYEIGNPTVSNYNDTAASPGTTYYYWVKARNARGDSQSFSTYDTGYRAQ